MRLKQILFRLFVNNFVCNFFIRKLGWENRIYKNLNPYLKFRVNTGKSTQENAGYSNRPEINEVLQKSKADLVAAVQQYVQPGSSILDVGCGPGMYLELFASKPYKLLATDINPEMLAKAKEAAPEAICIAGNFMDVKINEKLQFVYCIGMLIYIPSFQLESFFEKIHGLLQDQGILYINYPHATSLLDTCYNDLTYIKYSPAHLEKIASPYFDILRHEHAFDGRKVGQYDNEPYKSLNPDTNRTYKNSYLFIARKK